jgi:hypothetical protein
VTIGSFQKTIKIYKKKRGTNKVIKCNWLRKDILFMYVMYAHLLSKIMLG